MTKEEWDQVKTRLSSAYGFVELVVDGFNLTLQVKQTGPLTYAIFPYVNGEFKGVWCTQKTEEAVRFLCPKTVSIFKPKEKAALTKGLSKKSIKTHFPNIDKKGTYYTWSWTSFASLKRHLLANNKSIELKKDA